MIPQTQNNLIIGLPLVSLASKTYRITKQNCLLGHVDGLEAVKQAAYLILNVERYRYVIYSWNYGVELESLFGQPIPYILPEIKRRITEALCQDDRIQRVDGFLFDTTCRGTVSCTFMIRSIYGEFFMKKEVFA